MHNAACRALGIDAVYGAQRGSPEAVAAALEGQGATGGGGNVTVPREEAVEGSVARKADICARVGACNTFWTEDGVLVGDNTDVFGVTAALEQLGARRTGARWLVIGTGGSAPARAPHPGGAGAARCGRPRQAHGARG